MFENFKKNETGSQNKNNIIIKAIIYSVLLTLILLFIYSILLAYTNIPESTTSIAIIFISGVSILIFSIIAMLKIKNNGIINGGIIGFVYMFIIYLISSFIRTGFNFNIYCVLMIIAGILCGMIGGIIGVNIK